MIENADDLINLIVNKPFQHDGKFYVLLEEELDKEIKE